VLMYLLATKMAEILSRLAARIISSLIVPGHASASTQSVIISPVILQGLHEGAGVNWKNSTDV